MERFVFRPLTLADIALAIDKDATELRLTANADGVMELDTPNLTAAMRSQLRSLFSATGYVEDLTAGS